MRAAEIADACAELAAGFDASGEFPRASFDLIAGGGLLEIKGLDPLALLLLLKHMGRGDLSVGRLYEGHVNALQLIQTFGTQEQIERCEREVREQRLLFAVWNTEAGDGVTLVPLRDGRFQMQGAKTFASGAGNVQRPIVTGRLPDGGWQMCIVPMDEVDVTIDPSWWKTSGMRASTSFKVDFSGVELDPEALLGEPNAYHLQPWFGGGAIRFAAVQLGGAEALLDEARRFLRSLERTGDPFQRARFGEAAILIESGNLWLRGAAEAVQLGPVHDACYDIDRAVNYANMTRLAIERICLDAMEIAARAVGARGLLQPSPLERIIRDLTLYLRQPAPDAVQASVGEIVLERDVPAGRLWHG